MEYGLAGVPAVAFAVGGNGEVIFEGRTGYLAPPGDTKVMAERVIHLLANKDLREDMGRKAREHCEMMFSPDRVRGLTLDFFQSLIPQHESPSD